MIIKEVKKIINKIKLVTKINYSFPWFFIVRLSLFSLYSSLLFQINSLFSLFLFTEARHDVVDAQKQAACFDGSLQHLLLHTQRLPYLMNG